MLSGIFMPRLRHIDALIDKVSTNPIPEDFVEGGTYSYEDYLEELKKERQEKQHDHQSQRG